MAKVFNLFKMSAVLILVSILFSCSSDSDSPSGDDHTYAVGDFQVQLDGVQTGMNQLSSRRDGDKFLIYGSLQNGYYFQMEFHKSGSLGYIWMDTDPNDNIGATWFNTSRHFNSNYTTFNLISVNESTKTIKASFNGKLFRSTEDDMPTDNFKPISGEFEISYQNYEELYPVTFDCKMNDLNWHSTVFQYSSVTDQLSIEHHYSDNAYRIRYTFDGDGIATGTYTFTPATVRNTMILEKFDPITNTYQAYDSEGSITFSNLVTLQNGANEVTYDATFHFTATNPDNPSDIVEVTNGVKQGIFILD